MRRRLRPCRRSVRRGLGPAPARLGLGSAEAPPPVRGAGVAVGAGASAWLGAGWPASPAPCASCGGAATCRGAAFGAGRLSASATATSCDRGRARSRARVDQLRSPAACSPRPRRAAPRRRASGMLERGLDEPRRVLLVPVAARVRERAEQPLRLRELRARAPVLRLARGAREAPRPAGEDLVGRVDLALADRAQQDPDARRAVLLPRRRLRHERDEVVEVGALDGHRDAIGERDHAQPAVRVLGGARREELLERDLRRAALGELLGRTRRARRSGSGGPRSSPRTAARPRRGTSGRRAATRAGSPRAAGATSGVTGTSHGAGESLRRARRCWRRRGAGVTRAPSR